ncbi:hypothetical protein C4D60_Mb06t00290 [Musa balbisiana]|uniref:UBL3-like ubiquitin domain-containing protein n=1 Tax=Musa balbisiana TaxID=52838 RepID=A0A4S8IJK9_MUSBA|nr:hypothetical protein C4D60_Mb06t00290 [Musa balbisiana]
MAGDDLIELKFRLFDGTDIGPNKYDPSTTVASLKEAILARWPQGETSMAFWPLTLLVFSSPFPQFMDVSIAGSKRRHGCSCEDFNLVQETVGSFNEAVQRVGKTGKVRVVTFGIRADIIFRHNEGA